MNSHQNISETLLNQIIVEAHKTFVSGHLFNAIKIREWIKEEMKKNIRSTYPDGYTLEEFDTLFDLLFEEQFHEQFSLDENESKELSLRLPGMRTLIESREIEKRLAEKFHGETSSAIEKIKNSMMVRYPNAKHTPQTIFAFYAQEQRKTIQEQFYEEETENLPPEAKEELNRLIEAEKIRNQEWLEKQHARKKSKMTDDEQKDEEYDSDADTHMEIDVREEVLRDQFNKKFKQQLKDEIEKELKEKNTQALVCPEHRPDSRYLLLKDPCFPHYDANWIQGTNYIAMRGPKEKTLGTFIHHLLFSDEITKQPLKVTKIVALGNCIGKTLHFGLDFVDYSLNDNEPKKATYGEKSYRIKVTPKYRSLDYVITGDRNTIGAPRPQEPYGLIESHLTIAEANGAEREVDAIIIGMPDNHSVFLEEKSAEADKIKEVLWRLAHETNAVAIHCAAGVGRTGHLLLLLHLIKHYKTVFTGTDAVVIDQRTEDFIDRIRLSRAPLISTVQQKECAIRVAHSVIQYALKKGYVSAEGKVSTLGLLSLQVSIPRSREEIKAVNTTITP